MNTIVYGNLEEIRNCVRIAKTIPDPIRALELYWLVLDRRRRNTFDLVNYDKLSDRMNTILAVREEVIRMGDPAWKLKLGV